VQPEFDRDIRQAAIAAPTSTEICAGVNPRDNGNIWAVYDDYIDRRRAVR